ncbi:MAG: NADH:ubiquinone reductase (Na(+)-transporting) subunit C [Cytophagales bacterium]|nr:MAG: NADH:ubiquinone reductase (Na(+)-transporting) subunit C [Cytophagales bacterium]
MQSNIYIVVYTIALTVVCGVLLAMAAVGLKPLQDANIALEKKQNILGTVMPNVPREQVEAIYAKRVKAYVINNEGAIQKDLKAEDIDVSGEYKKEMKERLLPVYEILDSEGKNTEFYVFPVYGYGLWDNIWGYISLKNDLNTVNGVLFDHKSETPGLGARITSEEVQKRYKDKNIFEGNKLMSVTMMKGEGNDYSKDKYKVDGMSGATITGGGVNKMLSEYLACYENFIKSKSNKKVSMK